VPTTSDSSEATVRVPGTLRYALGVAVTVLAILSQYFVPQSVPATRGVYASLPGDLLVVYGIPVVTFSVLVGAGPLRRWRARMSVATWEGLRWYGLLSLLALFATLILAAVYAAIDPAALQLLNRPPPPLVAAQSDPWFWVGFSFVIGAVEETIFRGWIFGFWRDRPGSWVVPAAWTSVLFAGVHLYYGTTYGIAAPLIFPSLFLIGFAFAATYKASGGNLVVVSLLHGAYDASAFLTLISPEGGLLARYLPVLAGLVIALMHLLRAVPGAPSRPGMPNPGSR
jgi:membrane protease YdiL (CAAX protease family)